ncbi:MAG: Nif3-like dinuclear metal center hexameric protein [Bacteroidales bacterium]|nr:Nif3-like dinuclear metal center hexameric protein [Bacteroidales bacterium]MBN2764300.1 Nif3-like dinuclear metal center hexameric protein [Bacteroidales bacterium]
MRLSEIIKALEELAPPVYKESYDNVGLMTGDPQEEIRAALLAVDITEEVLEEALANNINLIISHHPLIFTPLKSITGKTGVEKILLRAIRKNIALLCAHTNLDNVDAGVNRKLSEKLGLTNARILDPVSGELRKLVTFVPPDYADKVRTALFNAGAGHIGKYDQCSYNLEGTGTFRGSAEARPFVGEKGKLHFEKEIRIETVFPKALTSKVVKSLLSAHPYEEAAYDIYPLDNVYQLTGAGMIGELGSPMEAGAFLKHVKTSLGCQFIRYSGSPSHKIKTVACCGGSGSSLIQKAIVSGADAFVTGDIKYHQFLDAAGDILLIDAGHFETEQFTNEIFYEFLIKKFPNFAIRFSKVNTNPIKYY